MRTFEIIKMILIINREFLLKITIILEKRVIEILNNNNHYYREKKV